MNALNKQSDNKQKMLIPYRKSEELPRKSGPISSWPNLNQAENFSESESSDLTDPSIFEQSAPKIENEEKIARSEVSLILRNDNHFGVDFVNLGKMENLDSKYIDVYGKEDILDLIFELDLEEIKMIRFISAKKRQQILL